MATHQSIKQPQQHASQNRVRSQQYPSPAAHNKDLANKQFIQVVKGVGKQEKIKTIDLARLPEFEADGWHEWVYSGRPDELGTDKDPRKVPRMEDIWEIDAPYKDTAHLFAAEIEMSRIADDLDWQLLGTDPKAQAIISHSPTFIAPSESSKNLQSATSRGHQLKFPRPLGVGAGWGDHDRFTEWQLHGRQVKKSMVEDKELERKSCGTYEFISATDGRRYTIPADDTSKDVLERDAEPPRTIFEMLNPRNQGGGHRGGDTAGWGQGQRSRQN